MAQTNYYLGKTTNSAGESEINLRLYVSRDVRLRVGSGIWIDRGRWGKKDDINIPLIQGEERELLLEKRIKLKSLTDYLENIINTNIGINTVDRIYIERQIQRFHKPQKLEKEYAKTFFDIINDYLTNHKLSAHRQKHFRVLMRCLMRFELYKRAIESRNFKLDISKLSIETLKEFEDFLGSEQEVFLNYPGIYDKAPYSSKVATKTAARKRLATIDADGNKIPKGMPKQRGQNTISDMFIRFRSFIIWANDNDYTKNNPFKNYSVGEAVYGSPIYISNEERNQLYNTNMSDDPALATQRDIFVFQCLIGCRVSDLAKMTHKNIINGSLEYIPRKTKEDRPITVRVPLSKTALEIIERYRDTDRESLLPFLSDQKYNVRIKEAFKRAGLDRMVTTIDQVTRQEVQRPLCEIASSHMARRSFIGNIYKQVKDPNLVSSLSGHKEGSKAFARYREIDDEMKKELISFLD